MVTMTSIVPDIRFGLRTLRREWMTSVVALVSIALGIGANIAIFTLVDALLLRPAFQTLWRIAHRKPTKAAEVLGLAVNIAPDCRKRAGRRIPKG